MIKTTYQEVWNTFVNFTGVNPSDLPQTDEGKYILINSGAIKYNSITEDAELKILCDDMMEELNISLDYNRMLLLVHCIKYIYLQNEKEKYESVWGVFSRDVGLKFYRETVQAKESTLTSVNNEIMRLLDKLDPMSYLG